MWEWIVFLGGTATILLWMSHAQPFPEISARWAWLMICVASLLAIATQGTRQTSPDVAPILSASIGGVAVVMAFDRHLYTNATFLLHHLPVFG